MEIIKYDIIGATKLSKMTQEGTKFLKNSILKDRPVNYTYTHVLEARKLLEVIAPINAETNIFYQHVNLVPAVARRIGFSLQNLHPNIYGNLNLNQIEVTSLFHDIGRFVTHVYHRNDLIAKLLLKKLELEEIYSDIPEQDRFFGKKPGDQNEIEMVLGKMNTIQKIIDMADVYGKPKLSGGIYTFEEVMQYHVYSRNIIIQKSNLFPSERKLTDEVICFAAEYYVELNKWFINQGVNPENIRKEIENNLI